MKRYVAFDCETDNLEANILKVVSYAYRADDGRVVSGVFDTREPLWREHLQTLLSESSPIFHNATFDVRVLRKFGFTVDHYDDTILMSYVWFPLDDHSLANWGTRLGIPKLDHPDFENATIDELIPYCIRDSEICLGVFENLTGKFQSDERGLKCYRYVDLPCSEVVMELEETGVKVDVQSWREQNTTLLLQAEQLLEKIVTILPVAPSKVSKTKKPRSPDVVWDGTSQPKEGMFMFLGDEDNVYSYRRFEVFNPSSSHQIHWGLSFLYGWEPTEFTETGLPSTTSEVLETLPNSWELPLLLIQYSELTKLTSTYGEAFLSKVSSDGRIRPRFNPTVTLTGRFSSSSPNIQNIPKSGDAGDVIRKAFVASDGMKLVGADCSNFQIRILAHYLDVFFGDTLDGAKLAEDFNTNDNADPHQVTADLLGVSRKEGKTLNFSVMFGSGAEKMGKMMGVDATEARKLQDKMVRLFPSISKLKELIWSQGVVVHDLYGRRGVYPNVNSKDKSAKAKAQRQQFNFVIQGTEATVVKQIMVLGKELCSQYKQWYPELPTPHIVLQVHDEVLYEVPEAYAYEFSLDLKDLFSLPFLPNVVMKGDVKIGDSWYEAH